MTSQWTRRGFLAAGIAPALAGAAAPPPNVLLITVDDMNWDTPGCFGGKVPGLTPNIDRLASEGMRFRRAHVTVAVCQPSRSVLMTGRYPHRNGAEGFGPIRTDVTTLQECLRARGYLNGIMAKNAHLAPKEKFCWDFYIEPPQLGHGRGPVEFGKKTAEFLARAKAEGKPFFLMANSQDPHRPFSGSPEEIRMFGEKLPVRRTISPEEAVLPKFLPDIPLVRKEVAQYLTCAHRADEIVGSVLAALKASGLERNTLVMFLSDNGMAFPFAKTNCYLNSTRTPWIVRWPGKVKAGSVNERDFISGIDFTPTVLEAAGIAAPAGMDGRSFLPLLAGRPAGNRESVVTVFHETSAHKRFEMRAIHEGSRLYIYNAWADGKTAFRNESQSGLTWRAMAAAAEQDPRIAERVKMFTYRTPEELYDLDADPNALHNLAQDPARREEVAAMRGRLLAWMKEKQDPLAAAYTRVARG